MYAGSLYAVITTLNLPVVFILILDSYMMLFSRGEFIVDSIYFALKLSKSDHFKTANCLPTLIAREVCFDVRGHCFILVHTTVKLIEQKNDLRACFTCSCKQLL